MKKIKKALRLLAFVCLIILACFGVGLVGGIPLLLSNRKDDGMEVHNESVEAEDEDADLKKGGVKS